MATPAGANDTAKLSSLFGKKKKGGIKSMNANVIAKENVPAAAAPVPVPATASAASTTKSSSSASSSSASSSIKPKPQSSPSRKPQAAPTKGVADLSIGDKKDAEEKRDFQWAKQPKKYKTVEPEGVAKSWAEQEERNKVNKRINLQSERAFPTLGADVAQVQLSSMKAPQAKAVATTNVWASLHDDDD